jgi:hypothetical protein
MPNPFCEAEMSHDGAFFTCVRCCMMWGVMDDFPPACQFDSNADPLPQEKQP